MSVSGRVAPFATSFAPMFGRTRVASASLNGVCAQCLRALRHTSQRPQSITRRFAATEAAQYRPHSFTPQPPPRNAGVPETSIAGGKLGVDHAEAQHPPPSTADIAKTGITEAEAQSSKSAPNKAGPVGSVASPGKPQRKSKLRPRKAAMRLTPAAVEALKELLDQPEPKMIRVGVKNRGCSGLAYHLEYVDKPGSFDEAVDQDGVKVLVDSKALFSIIGSEMDWVEDKLSRRFVFKNPNITEQCGCGESFSIS